MSFTPLEFRDAMGLFPTGVCVVTACAAEGHYVGLTVNSFTSVSLDPPLVLVSLARSMRSFSVFAHASHFAVSLLPENQRDLASAFARSGGDKWQSTPHRVGENSCPVIHPNLAAFECETYARHEGGDHMLLLGRVLRIERAADANPHPLLYFRGQYRELSDQHVEIAPFRLEGW